MCVIHLPVLLRPFHSTCSLLTFDLLAASSLAPPADAVDRTGSEEMADRWRETRNKISPSSMSSASCQALHPDCCRSIIDAHLCTTYRCLRWTPLPLLLVGARLSI